MYICRGLAVVGIQWYPRVLRDRRCSVKKLDCVRRLRPPDASSRLLIGPKCICSQGSLQCSRLPKNPSHSWPSVSSPPKKDICSVSKQNSAASWNTSINGYPVPLPLPLVLTTMKTRPDIYAEKIIILMICPYLLECEVWNRGLGVKPQMVPTAEPLIEGSWGKASTQAESFFSFSYKRGAKVKDLSDSLSLCPRQTAPRSHDQPRVVVIGGHLCLNLALLS